MWVARFDHGPYHPNKMSAIYSYVRIYEAKVIGSGDGILSSFSKLPILLAKMNIYLIIEILSEN